MPSRRDYDALFSEVRTALTNARDVAAVQTALVPYGYDPARLDEGMLLLARAETAASDQQTEYAEQYTAHVGVE